MYATAGPGYPRRRRISQRSAKNATLSADLPLWNRWELVLALAGVLTLEWWLRHRARLA